MHSVFVYGTLLSPSTRKQVLGRTPDIHNDTLDNFGISSITINTTTYPIAIHKKSSVITGGYFIVSDEELTALDRYETSAYTRKEVTLTSGTKSFVYCAS